MMRSSNSINGRGRREYGRPIPMRGQVKAAIVTGLAHSLSSMLSFASRSHSWLFPINFNCYADSTAAASVDLKIGHSVRKPEIRWDRISGGIPALRRREKSDTALCRSMQMLCANDIGIRDEFIVIEFLQWLLIFDSIS